MLPGLKFCKLNICIVDEKDETRETNGQSLLVANAMVHTGTHRLRDGLLTGAQWLLLQSQLWSIDEKRLIGSRGQLTLQPLLLLWIQLHLLNLTGRCPDLDHLRLHLRVRHQLHRLRLLLLLVLLLCLLLLLVMLLLLLLLQLHLTLSTSDQGVNLLTSEWGGSGGGVWLGLEASGGFAAEQDGRRSG